MTVSLYYQVEDIKLELEVHSTAVLVYHRVDNGTSVPQLDQRSTIYNTSNVPNDTESRWEARSKYTNNGVALRPQVAHDELRRVN